jgi:molybdate transport system substrate-binding protein
VLRKLAVAGKRCTFPNGATAMREMAAARAARVIGCTQETEIRNTPGVRLVAPLPPALELTTAYAAAVTGAGENADLARRFISVLRLSERFIK